MIGHVQSLSGLLLAVLLLKRKCFLECIVKNSCSYAYVFVARLATSFPLSFITNCGQVISVETAKVIYLVRATALARSSRVADCAVAFSHVNECEVGSRRWYAIEPLGNYCS